MVFSVEDSNLQSIANDKASFVTNNRTFSTRRLRYLIRFWATNEVFTLLSFVGVILSFDFSQYFILVFFRFMMFICDKQCFGQLRVNFFIAMWCWLCVLERKLKRFWQLLIRINVFKQSGGKNSFPLNPWCKFVRFHYGNVCCNVPNTCAHEQVPDVGIDAGALSLYKNIRQAWWCKSAC